MLELDDWTCVPESAPLADPIELPLDREKLEKLFATQIATDWDLKAFDRGEGWLSRLTSYRFNHRISIEGPSALYGGPFSPNAWTGAGGLCALGACSYSHSPLPEGMRVGRYCSIGRELKFLDFAHPTEWVSSAVAFFRPQNTPALTAIHGLIDRAGNTSLAPFDRREFDPKMGRGYPVLGHDVWIGERVTLGMGIRIGTGVVIAAGAIVTRDVPPYAVVAGVPAQIKRMRFDEATVAGLLASKWWRYHFAELNALDVTRPTVFLEAFDEAKASGTMMEWRPATLTLPDAWLDEATPC